MTFPGEVVSAQITIASGVKRAQSYVSLVIFRRGRRLWLAQGYVYDGHAVQLGENTEPGPGGGEGLVRSIDLGDPSANADYTAQTIPTNASWRLQGFNGTLVTDANSANREFTVFVTDGTDTVAGASTGNEHVASRTNEYFGTRGGISPQINQANVPDGSPVSFTVPDGIFPEAYVVTFNTTGLQAGDDWGDGQLLVEEWLVI